MADKLYQSVRPWFMKTEMTCFADAEKERCLQAVRYYASD